MNTLSPVFTPRGGRRCHELRLSRGESRAWRTGHRPCTRSPGGPAAGRHSREVQAHTRVRPHRARSPPHRPVSLPDARVRACTRRSPAHSVPCLEALQVTGYTAIFQKPAGVLEGSPSRRLWKRDKASQRPSNLLKATLPGRGRIRRGSRACVWVSGPGVPVIAGDAHCTRGSCRRGGGRGRWRKQWRPQTESHSDSPSGDRVPYLRV